MYTSKSRIIIIENSGTLAFKLLSKSLIKETTLSQNYICLIVIYEKIVVVLSLSVLD